MSDLKIEPIDSLGQLEACAPILVEAFNKAYADDDWTYETALSKLTDYFHSPRFLGFIVYEHEVVVGGCIGNIETYFSGDHYYLKELFVDPQGQGKGIGQLVMKRVKDELTGMGVPMISLYTMNEGPQYTFYDKQGFQPIEGMCMLVYGIEGE